jgi:RNA polymerase sigma-70 factor (ECF subfamily)
LARKADLIEQQIPSLRRYAFALTGRHEEADDLVQDCLERALSHWHMRRSDAALRSWLFSILHNRFISIRRRAEWRLPHDELESAGAQMTEAASQEHSAELSRVLAALGRLDEIHRSAILLVAVEDFSYQEAAAILQVPLGTLMSRLSRGRERLRGILDGKERPQLRSVK